MTNIKLGSIELSDQNIWLDVFSKRFIESKKLQTLVERGDITGITCNPRIFHGSVMNTSDYDEDIREMTKNGRDSLNIFTEILVKEARMAAGIFLPVFEKTAGVNGFVSVNLSPDIAYDTLAIIEQTEILWKKINRPNVMIKIPSTKEGVPAIRHCIAGGININVSLISGLRRYKEVLAAFMGGIEDRLKLNLPVHHISSVAGFHLNNIDELTDPILTGRKLEHLKGKVALATARKAFSLFKENFFGGRMDSLLARGMKPQYLLWTGTTVKDNSFDTLKYAEALVGKETITSITPESYGALMGRNHSGNIFLSDVSHADDVFTELDKRGIDIDIITRKLESDLINKNSKSLKVLMSIVERKGMYPADELKKGAYVFNT